MPDDISSPASAPPMRVLVADDNPVVRAGLTALLSGRDDIEVVAEASDGRQAFERTVQHRPDVVLLDVRMPGVDGISALPHLVRLAPVLMMTYSRETETVHEALRLGARGYLVHGEFTAGQLVSAVRDIRRGRPHFTASASRAMGYLPALPAQISALAHFGAAFDADSPASMDGQRRLVDADMVLEEFAQASLLSQANVAHSSQGRRDPQALYSELSQREVEIMDLIASGMTNQQIAAACFISQKTVKNHINRIFAKLYAGSRGEAIARWHAMARRGSAGRG
jgi:DNA-binding NarL/FixJ family response regulator